MGRKQTLLLPAAAPIFCYASCRKADAYGGNEDAGADEHFSDVTPMLLTVAEADTPHGHEVAHGIEPRPDAHAPSRDENDEHGVG